MENSEKAQGGVPKGMPIAAVVLLVAGLILRPIVDNVPEATRARNVILAALPFILIFAAIIITYMSVIWYVGNRLNDKISSKIYRPIEYTLMIGIAVGILFMFQPWVFKLFSIGFYILLASLFSYILWSHVRPKLSEDQEGLGPVSVKDLSSGLGE